MNNKCAKNKDPCPHLLHCSGCDPNALIVPPPIWQEVSSYFEKNNCSISLISQELSAWRLRAKLAVRQERRELKIGLFQRNTHHIVDIPDCRAHHPLINSALVQIKQEMNLLGVLGYEEKKRKGDVRYLQLTVERSSQKVQLVLVANASSLENKMELLAHKLFEKNSLWHSIWVNLQPLATNTIFGEKWHHLLGPVFLYEEVGKETIAFHPAAFFQAHFSLFEKIVESIQKNMKKTHAIVEFYAGVGVIGKCVKNKATHLFLVEENPFAKTSFLAALKKEEEHLFTYCSCDVDQQVFLCSQAEAIIVDPPRQGISPSLMKAIGQKKEGQLIYLSCSFSSLKKDIEQLMLQGWCLERAEGYLLFPGANHVEILVFLKK